MAVIVGAGPTGLLLAHLLLSKECIRDELLPIRIFEARDDPRVPIPLYKSRQYVVGLSARGRDAVSKVDGLWDIVKQEGVLSSQFVLHFGSRSIALKRDPDKPSLLVNQRSLAAALVRELEERYPREKVQVKFGARCIGASLDTHTARFRLGSSEDVVPYQLLVGADGSRSVVREAFIRQRGFDFQQVNMSYTFKVLQVPRPPELSEGAVHSFRASKQKEDGGSPTSISFGCFPTPNNGTSVLLSWSPDTMPKELLAIQSASELKSYIEKYMPPLRVPVEAAEAFLAQKPTTSMRVACSRFHDTEGKAVLIGDAAHAMSNALGQGCNSSLKDAEVLSEVLLAEKSLAVALEKYSEQQVEQDKAAAYLSEHAFPQANWLRPAYLLGNIISSGLSKTPLAPIVPPSIQNLCSETLTPYTEVVLWLIFRSSFGCLQIAKRNKFWLKLVEVTNVLN